MDPRLAGLLSAGAHGEGHRGAGAGPRDRHVAAHPPAARRRQRAPPLRRHRPRLRRQRSAALSHGSGKHPGGRRRRDTRPGADRGRSSWTWPSARPASRRPRTGCSPPSGLGAGGGSAMRRPKRTSTGFRRGRVDVRSTRARGAPPSPVRSGTRTAVRTSSSRRSSRISRCSSASCSTSPWPHSTTVTDPPQTRRGRGRRRRRRCRAGRRPRAPGHPAATVHPGDHERRRGDRLADAEAGADPLREGGLPGAQRADEDDEVAGPQDLGEGPAQRVRVLRRREQVLRFTPASSEAAASVRRSASRAARGAPLGPNRIAADGW